MSSETLGMVGTEGLVGAIRATDTMTKTTNVVLIGYEKIGSGLIIAMVRDDVGTVKASVDAGTAATASIGQIVSQYVIPGPHTDVEKILPKSSQCISKYIPANAADL